MIIQEVNFVVIIELQHIMGSINRMCDRGIIYFSCLKKVVGNGRTTHFLLDSWVGDVPLKDRFICLFYVEKTEIVLLRVDWWMVSIGFGIIHLKVVLCKDNLKILC